MPVKSQYELEREANIAKNRLLFEDLGLKQAVQNLGIPSTKGTAAKQKIAAPKRAKRERSPESVQPRRQSRRLAGITIQDSETPEEKAAREEAEAQAREAAEEKARAAKRARHNVLNFKTLAESNPQDLASLSSTLKSVKQTTRSVGDPGAFVYEGDEAKHKREVKDLREKLRDLKVVSRNKVSKERIYCSAYHPEVTKDLIFYGDKHGTLMIWDARAPADEVDQDGDIIPPENRGGGKYWHLQLHWPESSKSSISSIKVDPIDSHNIYTSSYDCTVRSLSFVSGTSQEIYSTDDGVLISNIDLSPNGHELWVSDGSGGVTHIDLRETKSKARRYGLSEAKIGCVSVNPTRPHYFLTASNSRVVRIWDARSLSAMPVSLLGEQDDSQTLLDFDSDIVNNYIETSAGKAAIRAEYPHNKSASSAYWDPRGRQIVSTSYDDTIRLWDIDSPVFDTKKEFPKLAPLCQIKHNCQTGKWVTILRAQWNMNPDAYPHFTIGNMKHSLDIYSGKGDLIAQLADPTMISAVQAVTCSHPTIVERAAAGNAGGKTFLWAPENVNA